MRLLTAFFAFWFLASYGFANDAKPTRDISRAPASENSAHEIWIPEAPPVSPVELPTLPPLVQMPSVKFDPPAPPPSDPTTSETPASAGLPFLLGRSQSFRELAAWLGNLRRELASHRSVLDGGEILGWNGGTDSPATPPKEEPLKTYLVVDPFKGGPRPACHHISLKDSETGEIRGDCDPQEIEAKAKTLLVKVNGKIERIRDPFSPDKKISVGLLEIDRPWKKDSVPGLWSALSSEGVAVDNVETVEIVGIESLPLSNFGHEEKDTGASFSDLGPT